MGLHQFEDVVEYFAFRVKILRKLRESLIALCNNQDLQHIMRDC